MGVGEAQRRAAELPMPAGPSSRARLNSHAVHLFPGGTLFDRLGRVLCEAGCLPRKELYEAWEVARRVRRHFRGGRVVDLACGHGLLAWLLLLLDDSSPRAIAVDARLPPCASRIGPVIARAWPRLAGRVELVAASIGDVGLAADDLVVSVHACGALTDEVLAAAAKARARVAVLPCCHRLARPLRSALEGWLDGPLAMDVERAQRLAARGYGVRTQRIPPAITPKNRLLMGAPDRIPAGECDAYPI